MKNKIISIITTFLGLAIVISTVTTVCAASQCSDALLFSRFDQKSSFKNEIVESDFNVFDNIPNLFAVSAGSVYFEIKIASDGAFQIAHLMNGGVFSGITALSSGYFKSPEKIDNYTYLTYVESCSTEVFEPQFGGDYYWSGWNFEGEDGGVPVYIYLPGYTDINSKFKDDWVIERGHELNNKYFLTSPYAGMADPWYGIESIIFWEMDGMESYFPDTQVSVNPEIYIPKGNQETSQYSSSIRYVDNGILDIHIDRTDISDAEWMKFAKSIQFDVKNLEPESRDTISIASRSYSIDEGVDLEGRKRGTIHILISFDGLGEINNLITIKSTTQVITVQILRSLDTDKDGILDEYEIYGVDTNGDGIQDLRFDLMGADPWIPDIFLEVECMDEVRPSNLSAKLDRIARVFAQHDINLHIDCGEDSYDYVTKKKWGDLSESTSIKYEEDLMLGTEEEGDNFKAWKDFYTNRLSEARLPYFRHCAIVNKYHYNNGKRSIGVAFTPGSSFIISMDEFNRTCEAEFPGSIAYKSYLLSASIMHELGHGLGLAHGSWEPTLYKPNHISIMNYMYTYFGLHKESDLSLLSTNIDDFFADAVINYSESDSPVITMSNINEKTAITLPQKYADGNIIVLWYVSNGKDQGNPLPSKAYKAVLSQEGIDFNQNGKFDESISLNFYLNGEYSYTVPNVVNEWEYLNLSSGLGNLFIDDVNALEGKRSAFESDSVPEGLIEDLTDVYIENSNQSEITHSASETNISQQPFDSEEQLSEKENATGNKPLNNKVQLISVLMMASGFLLICFILLIVLKSMKKKANPDK